MFYGCDKIIEIDLSKFDSSDVTILASIFEGCSSLTSINLSNIKTSKVTSMESIFFGCQKLSSLDLSDFDTSSITIMTNMFNRCINLEFINFKSLQLRETAQVTDVFLSTSDKLIICSENEVSIIASEYNQIKNVNCHNYNSNNINNKCYSKQSTFDNQFKCDVCGKNYVIKNNGESNNNINCYGEREGYYLDETNFNYKPCYESCKICKIKGDHDKHNCLECKDQFTYYINLNNTDYKNCYIENPLLLNNDISNSNKMLTNIDQIPFQNQPETVLEAI